MQTDNGDHGYPETADIETSSDGYAARFAGPVGEWMLSVQERLTRELLPGDTRGTVLDVGGGHGQLARPLCREGYAVTVLGSDISCRRRIEDLLESGACHFLAGNVVALPFPNQSFDVAMSFRLLPHCERWPKLVTELCRVARQAVVVDFPVSQGFNALAPALFGAKRKLEENTRTWRSFTLDEVTQAFQAQGWRVAAVRREFFFPMALHRALRARGFSSRLETLARCLRLTAGWGSPLILKAIPSPS